MYSMRMLIYIYMAMYSMRMLVHARTHTLACLHAHTRACLQVRVTGPSEGGLGRWFVALRAAGEGVLAAEVSEKVGSQWSPPIMLVSHRQEVSDGQRSVIISDSHRSAISGQRSVNGWSAVREWVVSGP